MFESVVGGLQPILTRLPKLIEETVLSKATSDDARRDEALGRLETEFSAEEGTPINLDDFSDEELTFPPRLGPALTLSDLKAVLDRPVLLPRGTEAVRLDTKDYRFTDGFLPQAVRVTVDREFYELHSESVELWTPGSPTFPDLDAYRRTVPR